LAIGRRERQRPLAPPTKGSNTVREFLIAANRCGDAGCPVRRYG